MQIFSNYNLENGEIEMFVLCASCYVDSHAVVCTSEYQPKAKVQVA